MAWADQFGDMIHVSDDRFGSRLQIAEITARPRDADEATCRGACADLLIVKITERGCERSDIGMAEDRRCVARFERFQRRAAADMAEVEQHPDPIHLTDEPSAETGEASILFFRAATSGTVRRVERKQCVANAQGVKGFNQIKVSLEAAGSFEVDADGKLVLSVSVSNGRCCLQENEAVVFKDPAASGGNSRQRLARIVVVSGDR